MGYTIERRQCFIERTLNPKLLSIVEIGALDSPTYPPDQYNVRFIDRASKDQLLRENPNRPRFTTERLVDVDYVIPELQRYAESISERFDLAIANHLIEHIPNTARWLSSVASILKAGGYLFLAVPDRRYTFDYVRPETTIADVVRAYRNDLREPDFSHLFEHYYCHRPIKSQDAWTGGLAGKAAKPRHTIEEAMALAEQNADPAGIHCNVYTYHSFLELLSEMRAANLCPFDLADSCGVQFRGNEFFVLLRLAR
jgi:SAM-dependent methyltransferase